MEETTWSIQASKKYISNRFTWFYVPCTTTEIHATTAEIHAVAVSTAESLHYVDHEYAPQELINAELSLRGIEESCGCFRFGAFFMPSFQIASGAIWDMSSYTHIAVWGHRVDPVGPTVQKPYLVSFFASEQAAFTYSVWAKNKFKVSLTWQKNDSNKKL